MTRFGTTRWWVAAALLLGATAGCDDGPTETDRTLVTITGEVRLDGSPATADVTLEDLSVGSGIERVLERSTTDADGRYTLQAEVDTGACSSLYVSVVVAFVREGASGQVGASEPTRGCGPRSVDFELTAPT